MSEQKLCYKPAALLLITTFFFAGFVSAEEATTTIEPGKVYEDCFAVEKGSRIKLSFNADDTLKFNIHYHDGKEVVYIYPKAKTDNLSLNYKARIGEKYCLMWHSRSKAPIKLDYQYEILTKGSS